MADTKNPVAARAGGARTDVEAGDEPRREEFEPHVAAAERRAPQKLNVGNDDPGQEGDPKLSDSIDEGLARALPLDDALNLTEDLPLADQIVEQTAFPLIDPSPNRLSDDEVGDVDDEIRLEEEQEAEEDILNPVVRKRSS